VAAVPGDVSPTPLKKKDEAHNLNLSTNIKGWLNIKGDEIGGTYSTHFRDVKCTRNFS
jgi:hypothetical protein